MYVCMHELFSVYLCMVKEMTECFYWDGDGNTGDNGGVAMNILCQGSDCSLDSRR